MSLPLLPQDIIECVIDQLSSDSSDDQPLLQCLKPCISASRVFRRRALFHIFRKVDFTINRSEKHLVSRLGLLSDLISDEPSSALSNSSAGGCESTSILPFIRSFYFNFPGAYGPNLLRDTPPELLKIMKKLYSDSSRLETLYFGSDFYINHDCWYDENFREALIALVRARNLKTLGVYNIPVGWWINNPTVTRVYSRSSDGSTSDDVRTCPPDKQAEHETRAAEKKKNKKTVPVVNELLPQLDTLTVETWLVSTVMLQDEVERPLTVSALRRATFYVNTKDGLATISRALRWSHNTLEELVLHFTDTDLYSKKPATDVVFSIAPFRKLKTLTLHCPILYPWKGFSNSVPTILRSFAQVLQDDCSHPCPLESINLVLAWWFSRDEWESNVREEACTDDESWTELDAILASKVAENPSDPPEITLDLGLRPWPKDARSDWSAREPFLYCDESESAEEFAVAHFTSRMEQLIPLHKTRASGRLATEYFDGHSKKIREIDPTSDMKNLIGELGTREMRLHYR